MKLIVTLMGLLLFCSPALAQPRIVGVVDGVLIFQSDLDQKRQQTPISENAAFRSLAFDSLLGRLADRSIAKAPMQMIETTRRRARLAGKVLSDIEIRKHAKMAIYIEAQLAQRVQVSRSEIDRYLRQNKAAPATIKAVEYISIRPKAGQDIRALQALADTFFTAISRRGFRQSAAALSAAGNADIGRVLVANPAAVNAQWAAILAQLPEAQISKGIPTAEGLTFIRSVRESATRPITNNRDTAQAAILASKRSAELNNFKDQLLDDAIIEIKKPGLTWREH